MIDWEEQWRLHAPGFRDGYVHFGSIKMEPGPGFGDLSHPTTHLVISLMKEHVKDRHVIDIGSGSGILSLCAMAMGAKSVHGVDIEPEAVAHARKNAKLNNMDISFSLPHEFHLPAKIKSVVILMNMIRSEQAVAWKSLKSLHKIPGNCIISGILQEELQDYLEQVKPWGFSLQDKIEEEGWLGLYFNKE